MSEDIRGEHRQAEANSHQDGAAEEAAGTLAPKPPNQAANSDGRSEPPNWVEKGTLAVLVLTLIAAGAAAFEADRLARDTERALSDARDVAADTHADTLRAEKLTSEAVRQAAVANAIARDNSASSHADSAASNATSAEAMESANRAWISPRTVLFAEPFEVGKPIKLRIMYENTGHQPALDIGAHFSVSRIDKPPFSPLSAEATAIGSNTTCGKASPMKGAAAVYPSSSAASSYLWDFDRPTFVGDTDIESGKQVLVAEGCIKYRTFGKIRKTLFCFILVPVDGKPFSAWEWTLCPIGFGGD